SVARAVVPPVQLLDLLGEFGGGPGDLHPGGDLLDGQRPHRRGGHTELVEPAGQLRGGGGVHDAAQAHPRVRGCAHRAVLPGGVDGGGGAFRRGHAFRGPARQLELGVPGAVPGGRAVAVLGQHGAVAGHEDRAEGVVTRLQRLGRQLHAAAQVRQFGFLHDHDRPSSTRVTTVADQGNPRAARCDSRRVPGRPGTPDRRRPRGGPGRGPGGLRWPGRSYFRCPWRRRRAGVGGMDPAALLALFDAEVRRGARPDGPGARTERTAAVVRQTAPERGWNGVLWSALTERDADAVIPEQISRFTALGPACAWKPSGHGRPADLGRRLVAAGSTPGPDETLMIGEIAALNLDAAPPEGVDVVPVTDPAGVGLVAAVHERVFGTDGSRLRHDLLARLADGSG